MDLRKLPADSEVFIDTNIFLYAISNHPRYGAACNEFLDRVKTGEITGRISVIVLNELLHKLMLGEIAEKENIKLSQVIRFIRNNREILKGLKAYSIVEDVETNYKLSVTGVDRDDFDEARRLMKKELLLSNDAHHLAVMRREEIVNLATRDSDFATVEGIEIWEPGESERSTSNFGPSELRT